jgi:hypothetical protein
VGSLLANANLLLPLWVIVVLVMGEFFVWLASLTEVSFIPLIGQRLEIAFGVLIPAAVLVWFAHRYGLQPRLIDPFRLGRYYTGLIALTTLTIICVWTIPYALAALGHTVNFGMWFFMFQLPSLLGLFTPQDTPRGDGYYSTALDTHGLRAEPTAIRGRSGSIFF